MISSVRRSCACSSVTAPTRQPTATRTDRTPSMKFSLRYRISRRIKRPTFIASSCQQLCHYLALHIGQPIITTLEAVDQLFVIETHQVEDGRLQIVDVDRI